MKIGLGSGQGVCIIAGRFEASKIMFVSEVDEPGITLDREQIIHVPGKSLMVAHPVWMYEMHCKLFI
jgi:hypothetical protein